MTQLVVTAPAATAVEEIVRIMERRGIKRVVVTAETGAMMGIVTRADIIRAVAAEHDAANLAAALSRRGRSMAID